MKKQNSIDNLFKEGLQDYTVSVKSKELAFIKDNIYKNSFLKFSLIRLNIYYVSVIAVLLFLGSKEYFKQKNDKSLTVESVYTHNEVTVKNNDLNTASHYNQNIIQEAVTNSEIKVELQENQNQSIPIVKDKNTIPIQTTSTQNKNKQELPRNNNIENLAAKTDNTTISKNISAFKADSANTLVKPKAVVYVKPKSIEVVDTVIKVVKRKKKK